MGSRVVIILAIVITSAAVPQSFSHANSAAARTTEDGVYSASQALQSKALYKQKCSACHLDDLSGSGESLPLAGSTFILLWKERTPYDLFDAIETTMPKEKPKSLSGPAVVDLIAYVLQNNGFPRGKHQLGDDPNALRNIEIVKEPSPTNRGK